MKRLGLLEKDVQGMHWEYLREGSVEGRRLEKWIKARALKSELRFGIYSAALWRMDYRWKRSVRRLSPYPGENLWSLGTRVVEVVMELELEKPSTEDLLELRPVELAGKLRWDREGEAEEERIQAWLPGRGKDYGRNQSKVGKSGLLLDMYCWEVD